MTGGGVVLIRRIREGMGWGGVGWGYEGRGAVGWGGVVGWEVACGDCAVSFWPGETRRGALASGGTNDNDRCINQEAVCVCGWVGVRGEGGGVFLLWCSWIVPSCP